MRFWNNATQHKQALRRQGNYFTLPAGGYLILSSSGPSSADDPAPPPPGLTSGDGPTCEQVTWTPAPKSDPLGDAPVFKRQLTLNEITWPSEWHLVALMAAQGYSQRYIAGHIDYSESRISIIINKPEVQERIERIRKENASDLGKRYAQIAPRALDYFERIVDGKETANVGQRLTAAQWILEKKDGKPKQELDVDSGATILHLLQAMDAAKAAKAAGIQQTPQPQDDAIDVTPPRDELADWVATNLNETKEPK